MTASDFANLVRCARTNPEALRNLMMLAFEVGFMARLAANELAKLGISIERSHDSQAKAGDVR